MLNNNCSLYFINSNKIDLNKPFSFNSVYGFEISHSNNDSIKYKKIESKIMGALRYTNDQDIESFINNSNIIVELVQNKSSYSSFHLEPSSTTEVRIIMYELLNFSELKSFEEIGKIEKRIIKTIEIEIKPIKVIHSKSGDILNNIKLLLRDDKLDNLLGDS